MAAMTMASGVYETGLVFGVETTQPQAEVVLLFRPVCSLVKVDQGFTSGCHSHGFGFAGMDLFGGQDGVGRMRSLSVVAGQPFADTGLRL